MKNSFFILTLLTLFINCNNSKTSAIIDKKLYDTVMQEFTEVRFAQNLTSNNKPQSNLEIFIYLSQKYNLSKSALFLALNTNEPDVYKNLFK